MKIIKITTENKITALDYPEGSFSQQNHKFRELIGPKCFMYEHVRPKRLYRELRGSAQPGRKEGSAVSMLIDEEGHYNDLDFNTVGSWLYESDKHGHPILGDILIIGEYLSRGGIAFSGLSDEQFNLLYPQLKLLALKAASYEEEE